MAENISTLLSQVATIAAVRCKALGMKRLDKDASRKVERDHNAASGISNVSVSRLAGAELRVKEITDYHTEARNLLTDMSTAWGDRRLLPNALLEKFMLPWGEIKSKHDAANERFKQDVPSLIDAANDKKGNFNVKVPTIEECMNAFDLSFTLEPVPDVSTYKSGNLDKAVEKILKERFEANIKAAYTEAQVDAVQRLAEPLQNLVKRLGDYETKESEKARGITSGKNRLYDSLIGNVQEIAEVFGQWNLTNDPIMKRLDDALSAFSNLATEDLRGNADLRKDTAARASKILDEIRAGGYL